MADSKDTAKRTAAASARAQPISDTVYQALREDIVTLVRPPGSALSDKKISAELGISRTPVREAILKLVEEELVLVRPNSGTLVTRIRPSRLKNAHFLRRAIECAGIGDLGLVRKSDLRQVKSILSAQQDAIETENIRSFYALDDKFHAHLLTLSGHGEAWPAVQKAKGQLDRVRYLAVSSRARMERVLEQHRAVFEAIETQDPSRAEAALALHLTDSFRAVEKAVLTFSEYFDPD